MIKTDNRLTRRIIRYGGWGAGIGACLSALPLVAYLVFGNRTFVELQTTLQRVLLLYIVGGCIAGILVGAVMPLIRSDTIAGLVGAIIGVMGASAILIMDTRDPWWAPGNIFVVLMAGIPLGGALGVNYRRSSQQEDVVAKKNHGQPHKL